MSLPPTDRSTCTLDAPLARGTLGRRLVIRVVMILTALAIVVSALSLVVANQMLMQQLDVQLETVASRQPKGNGPDDDPKPGYGEYGNPIGTIKCDAAEGVAVATVLTEQGPTSASPEVVAQLLSVPTDGQARTVSLDELGSYRVRATVRNDRLQVAALPLNQVHSVLGQIALVEAGVLMAAIIAAVSITRAVVVSSLRPLNRVASTARNVSQLRLDRGEVSLPVRVAPRDADPTNEVGNVGQALNHMIDNVESALAARQRSETKVRQFVADASHELRNPLASIRGYAELTRRGRTDLPEQTQFAMSRIESEAERMSSLVEDLLLLARLDNAQGVDVKPTEVVEVVLNAVSDARAVSPEHVWRVDLPETEVTAMADPNRLTQVVVNLLSNARKHTPAGTTVTTSVHREHNFAVVSVSDNGPGIPDEVRSTIFERFARADTARAHRVEPSTGLGLSIVQAVMAAHGGRVEVSSAAGTTTFALYFPLAG